MVDRLKDHQRVKAVPRAREDRLKEKEDRPKAVQKEEHPKVVQKEDRPKVVQKGDHRKDLTMLPTTTQLLEMMRLPLLQLHRQHRSATQPRHIQTPKDVNAIVNVASIIMHTIQWIVHHHHQFLLPNHQAREVVKVAVKEKVEAKARAEAAKAVARVREDRDESYSDQSLNAVTMSQRSVARAIASAKYHHHHNHLHHQAVRVDRKVRKERVDRKGKVDQKDQVAQAQKEDHPGHLMTK